MQRVIGKITSILDQSEYLLNHPCGMLDRDQRTTISIKKQKVHTDKIFNIFYAKSITNINYTKYLCNKNFYCDKCDKESDSLSKRVCNKYQKNSSKMELKNNYYFHQRQKIYKNNEVSRTSKYK